MNLSKILKNVFLVFIFGLIVTACATKKSVKTTTESTTKAAETQKADPIEKLDALMQGDVYIGTDTVKSNLKILSILILNIKLLITVFFTITNLKTIGTTTLHTINMLI